MQAEGKRKQERPEKSESQTNEGDPGGKCTVNSHQYLDDHRESNPAKKGIHSHLF